MHIPQGGAQGTHTAVGLILPGQLPKVLVDTPPHLRSVSSSGTRVQGEAGRWECIWPDLVPSIMGSTPHTNGQRSPQTTQFTALLLKGEKQAQGKGCGANKEALTPKWFPQFSRFSVTPILSSKLDILNHGRACGRNAPALCTPVTASTQSTDQIKPYQPTRAIRHAEDRAFGGSCGSGCPLHRWPKPHLNTEASTHPSSHRV